MSRKNYYGKGNEPFTCEKCDMFVEKLSNGSFRNHCPYCLHSKHVDIIPGDRLEICMGLMGPIGIEKHSQKGWMIVHKCQMCSKICRNKTAPEDNVELLVQLF